MQKSNIIALFAIALLSPIVFVVVHEAGHAIAVLLAGGMVYDYAVNIGINGINGHVTHAGFDDPTTSALVSAAGDVATCIVAVVMFRHYNGVSIVFAGLTLASILSGADTLNIIAKVDGPLLFLPLCLAALSALVLSLSFNMMTSRHIGAGNIRGVIA
jgi:hypothetical protein